MADSGELRPRYWTWTTSVKLEVLTKYLRAFNIASQGKARHRVYIDLFAGIPENRDRETDEVFAGSARLALQTEPPFTVARCVELPAKAHALEATLRQEFPGRDIEVVPGDCNEVIGDLLTGLGQLEHYPTFAFVDPDGMQVAWSTLEALARHKPSSSTKVEIWMLLSTPGIMRTLALDPAKLTGVDIDRATRLFGTDGWLSIYDARRGRRISASRARAEYMNLMRWQLQEVLGYRHTHGIALHNERGTPMYDMVFATDHDAGNRIMASLYRDAYRQYPQMRQKVAEERRDRAPQQSLFGPEELHEASNDSEYQHEPPHRPYGWDLSTE